MEENRVERTRDSIPAPSTDSDAPIIYPKARILIPALILLLIIASIISGSIGESMPLITLGQQGAMDSLAVDFFQTFVFLGGIVLFSGISLKHFFRSTSNTISYKEVINLTLFLLIFSWTSYLLLYIPLSYVIPQFVTEWALSTLTLFPQDTNGELSIGATVIMFSAIVIFAPIFEEIFFRGYLFKRWQQKWNTKTAVIVTSVLFGLLHTDPIGAAAFGVLMCLFYMKTNSLFLPILAHALNNLIAWSISAAEYARRPDYVYNLNELQSEWLLLIGLLIITCIWAYLIIRSSQNPFNWFR